MSEDLTRPFDPQDSGSSYDWDYGDDERPAGPRILWGRVAALAAALVLVFLLGRASAPGGGSDVELEQANDRIAELEAEVDTLQAEVAAASEEPAESVAPSESPADDGGTATGEGETYVVESGDTLNSIAEEFYGDVSLADVIAEANDIDDPSALSVGTELTIPPEP